MYTLANDALQVSVLDPVADRDRFGVRYCTGGYIFQITDARVGELLSGPTYPDSFNWFDGQGIPDAFNLSPLTEPGGADALALILGIGVCDVQAKTVLTFCDWEITQQDASIELRTVHNYQRYAVELVRTVTLDRRTVRSATRVRNNGPMPIPMRWFPHPFYPQPDGDELLKLNLPLAPIADESYRLGENGYILRQGWPWDTGHYLPLNHTPLTNLMLLQKHPKLGLVAAVCSYAPDYFPIWGNPRTFSWEPFLERTIGHGQEFSWWIDYEF
jgi:hypothetical protein